MLFRSPKSKTRKQKTTEAVKICRELDEFETAFVAEYLGGTEHRFKVMPSAIAAGWPKERAISHGWMLLKRPHIAKIIQEWRRARIGVADASLDRYTRELLGLCYTQARHVVDWTPDDVRVLPPDLIDDSAHAAIAEIKLGEDGVTVKLHGKLEAMKLLGQLLGFLDPDEAKKTDEQAAVIARILKGLDKGSPSIERPG